MKRQTRPFAVEIKRSRRSTPQHETSDLDLLENKIASPGPGKPAPIILKDLSNMDEPEESADLKIPVFLQAPKDNLRPQSPSNAPAGSTKSSFWKLDKTSGDTSPAPRILPCLPSASEEENIEAEPARTRVRSKRLAFTGLPRHHDSNPNSAEAVSETFEKAALHCSLEPHSRLAQAGELTPDPALAPPKRRMHRFLKVDRENAASLPPGQRWKRRLLNRAR